MIKVSTINITPEILSLISEIDEFKGAWRAFGQFAPEQLSGLKRVAICHCQKDQRLLWDA